MAAISEMADRFGDLVYSGLIKVFRDPHSRHEVVQATDSVAFLVHIEDLDQVVLVNQERPSMVTEENGRGLITETPAGRFDVNLTPQELVAKEAQEEIGGSVDRRNVVILNNGHFLALSPGILTERQVLAYVKVDSTCLEPDRVFGVPGEEVIKRMPVPVEDLASAGYVFEDMKTFALVQWFLGHLRSRGRRFPGDHGYVEASGKGGW